MIRRNVRLRKEYLYRKSLEGKERELYEKKKRIQDALAEGKSIPTELREEERALSKELNYDDDVTTLPQDLIDDEYAKGGLIDPKIFLTTSRDPSSRLTIFAKELKLLFPNCTRINRGAHVLPSLVSACQSNSISDLIIVSETRGQPDGMIISHFPFGPTAYFTISQCVLRHDVEAMHKKPMSQAYPHLIFNRFDSKLGIRVMNILKYLFPVPKEDSQRVITFANDNDNISFRHHVYRKNGKEIELEEVGPRFELKLYQIRLGTLDQTEADLEWTLRPFMNSARKRQFLSSAPSPFVLPPTNSESSGDSNKKTGGTTPARK